MTRAKVPDSSRVFSEARRTVIRREYPLGTPTLDILEMVRALPGRHVVAKRITIEAKALGVKRPAEFIRSLNRACGAHAHPPLRVLPATPQQAESLPVPVEAPAPPAKPSGAVVATVDQIYGWALPRGVLFTGRNLDAVNRLRKRYAQPPFVLAGSEVAA